MDKLTIEEVESWEGASYHGPIIFIDKSGKEIEVSALGVAGQLADTMRENERLRTWLLLISEFKPNDSATKETLVDLAQQALSNKDSVNPPQK